MIVEKVFEFSLKPEQPGLSCSICLKVMMEQHDICKYDQFNWCSLTPAYLLNLYSLMPKRMAAMTTSMVGATKYQCITIILLKKLLFIMRLNEVNLRFIMSHFICTVVVQSTPDLTSLKRSLQIYC